MMILLMAPSLCFGQLMTGDRNEMYYAQSDIGQSYAVSLKSRSLDRADTTFSEKGIILIKKYENGLLKELHRYQEGRVNTCYHYSYNGTKRTKCVVKNDKGKVIEQYQYNYDKNNEELLFAKGNQGRKMIYKIQVSKREDTLITETYYNYGLMKTNEKEFKIVSQDALKEFIISKDENSSYPLFTTREYNDQKQLILEIDSSALDYQKKEWIYDHENRITEIYFSDSLLRYKTIYEYYPSQTVISSYRVYYQRGLQTILSKRNTVYLDNEGKPDYEEIIHYIPWDNSLLENEMIVKHYNCGKLTKVVVKTADNMEYLYTFRYFE